MEVETGRNLVSFEHRASALSIIVGKNAKKYDCFENEIKMWVYEEMIGDRKLSEIINSEHENVKYPMLTLMEISFIPRICMDLNSRKTSSRVLTSCDVWRTRIA